ncbi:MAG: HAD family hydrolase [Phycisphaerae bacterium]|nr:HAD family hydrolase [Phycisphaerae bacterium]
MNYKHIIWDWNGTLLNDSQPCAGIVQSMMQARNLGPLPIERYKDEIDFPIVDFYKKLGFDFQTESYDDIAREYINAYLNKIKSCSLQEGATQTLERLSQAGITHSLLSAYNQERLEEAVHLFNLTDRFTKLIGTSDYYAKGKIDNGRKWIEQLHFDTKEVLFVGDMLHDHEVAQAMKVDCVLLTCGHQSRKCLAQCNVPMFDSLDEFVTGFFSNDLK